MLTWNVLCIGENKMYGTFLTTMMAQVHAGEAGGSHTLQTEKNNIRIRNVECLLTHTNLLSESARNLTNAIFCKHGPLNIFKWMRSQSEASACFGTAVHSSFIYPFINFPPLILHSGPAQAEACCLW